MHMLRTLAIGWHDFSIGHFEFETMRNVIVFINICIVAVVTMLLVDFEAKDSKFMKSETVGASMADPSPGVPALATLKRSVPTRAKKVLSEKEARFVNDFIHEMTQLRMLDREQSKLAVQRGTSRPLKDYGAWLVINQQQMLDDLKKIATTHNVESSSTLDPSLTAELSALEQLHGKKFDSHYIKSLSNELKRDIKRLERASYSQDADVQVFAARYLQITKDNLSKVQEIRRNR
jgi:predicted outer membrane protein